MAATTVSTNTEDRSNIAHTRCLEIIKKAMNTNEYIELEKLTYDTAKMAEYKAKAKELKPKVDELNKQIEELNKAAKPNAAAIKKATADLAKLQSSLTTGDFAGLSDYIRLKGQCHKYADLVRFLFAHLGEQLAFELLNRAAELVHKDVESDPKHAKKTIRASDVQRVDFSTVPLGSLLNASLVPRVLPPKVKKEKATDDKAAEPVEEAEAPKVSITDPNYFMLTHSKSFEGGINNIWSKRVKTEGSSFNELKLSSEVKAYLNDLIVDFIVRTCRFLVLITEDCKTVRVDKVTAALCCVVCAHTPYNKANETEVRAAVERVSAELADHKPAKAAATAKAAPAKDTTAAKPAKASKKSAAAAAQ